MFENPATSLTVSMYVHIPKINSPITPCPSGMPWYPFSSGLLSTKSSSSIPFLIWGLVCVCCLWFGKVFLQKCHPRYKTFSSSGPAAASRARSFQFFCEWQGLCEMGLRSRYVVHGRVESNLLLVLGFSVARKMCYHLHQLMYCFVLVRVRLMLPVVFVRMKLCLHLKAQWPMPRR